VARIVVPYFAPDPKEATAEIAEGLRLVVSKVDGPLGCSKHPKRPGALPGQTVTVRLSVEVTPEEAGQLAAMIQQGRGDLRVRPAEPPQAPHTTLPQRPVAKAGDLVEIRMPAHNAQPFFTPDDLAKALQHLDPTSVELASMFKFINQVGPMPPANGNEAPAEPPGVVQLRADLGAVASATARVLGLLGCPFPAVHRLTFDAQYGWRALLDAGDGKPWRLRTDNHGDDASAAIRAALASVAGWLAVNSPAWWGWMHKEPLREALAGLIEAVSTGYARAGGGW